MDLLIKGGTVVTATSSFKADVAVKNGKISAIGANLKPEKKTEVVDAKGKMILPGAIDGHTHLAMPFGGTVASNCSTERHCQVSVTVDSARQDHLTLCINNFSLLFRLQVCPDCTDLSVFNCNVCFKR